MKQKQKDGLTVTAAKLLAVAAMVCASAVGARADRFNGGSFDGHSQSEAQWTTQFPVESRFNRFNGGSFDGYDAVTVQKAMLLRPPKGTMVMIR